jgi:dinuclear metal center YbgI/SA1388 family protein
MLLADLDALVRATLDFARFEHDVAINGLQVARSQAEVSKAAFAVDASLESFRRAAGAGAQLLFVHHGLFWGSRAPLTRTLYQRVRFLIEHDLALYAAHLPLDAHPELGNNIGLARRLGLAGIEPFGDYHGTKIGFKGRLDPPRPLERLAALVSPRPLSLLAFGPAEIRSVGIVSGGDPHAVSQAVAEGLDLFVTGDASHEIYHEALEAGINVLSGGHYATETWGITLMSEYLRGTAGLETVVLDIPTGL